jgi:hypothetical protein
MVFISKESLDQIKGLNIPMATTTVKRASTFAPGIGKNLTDILDTDVIVTKVSITERNFEGEPRPCVMITLEDGTLYHAWSESLADKIAEIPLEEYPLTFKFVRVATRKYPTGVITFE